MPLISPKVGFKLILCDAAQTDQSTGKIHMLGAGWTMTTSPTSSHAVAVLIQVPWDRTNQKLPVKVELLNADGQPVMIPGRTHDAIAVESELEVGRPAGIAPGSTLSVSFALNVGSLPLTPGGLFKTPCN